MGCGNIKTKDDEEEKNYNDNNENHNHIIVATLKENHEDLENNKKFSNSTKNISNYSLNENSNNSNNNKNNNSNNNDNDNKNNQNNDNFKIKNKNNNHIHYRINDDSSDLSRLINLSASSSTSNLDNTNVSFLNTSSNMVTLSNIFSPETTNNNNNNNIIINDNKNNSLQVNVYANKFETLYPIWIEKNNEITFEVSGKWNIEKHKECDCTGLILSNNLSDLNEFNEGALIGRVLGDKNFAIFNKLKYKSKYSGPLFMKMNVYNFFNKISQPFGSLNVTISGTGVYEKSIEEIEKSIFQIYNYNNDVPNFEKEIIIKINQMRSNSKYYAMMYLEDFKWFNDNSKKVYNEFVNMNKKLKRLNVNKNLFTNIKKFYVDLFHKNSKKKKKKILESENDLKEFLNNIYNINNNSNNEEFFKVFISIHDSLDSKGVCGKLLLNDIMRKEILNEKNEYISVLTMKTTKLKKQAMFSIFVFNNEFNNNKDLYEKIHIKKLNKNLDIIKEEDNLQSGDFEYNLSNNIFNYNNDKLENTNENIDKKEINEYDRVFRNNTYNSNFTEEDKHINNSDNNNFIEDKNEDENNNKNNKLEINVENINNHNNFIKIENYHENEDNINNDNNNSEENNINKINNNNNDIINENKDNINNNNINNDNDNINENKDNINNNNSEENNINKINNNDNDNLNENKDNINNNNSEENNDNNIIANSDNIIENKEKSIVIENNEDKITKNEENNNKKENSNKKIIKIKIKENENNDKISKTDINLEKIKSIKDDKENILNNMKND